MDNERREQVIEEVKKITIDKLLEDRNRNLTYETDPEKMKLKSYTYTSVSNR